MSEKTLAAAVARAADTGTAAAKAPTEPITIERVRTESPDVFAAIADQGAEAEHNRIIAIESASMPGHEKLIDAHKKDRRKTGADAAMAVIQAERDQRSRVIDGLQGDEARLKGLRSEPPVEVAPKPQNPMAEAYALKSKASEYIAKMAAQGVNISAAEAVIQAEKEH